MSIDHEPPQDFPPTHLCAVAVPTAFARVTVAAAEKYGRVFEDQLLHWAQLGAECERLHAKKDDHPRTAKSPRRKP